MHEIVQLRWGREKIGTRARASLVFEFPLQPCVDELLMEAEKADDARKELRQWTRFLMQAGTKQA